MKPFLHTVKPFTMVDFQVYGKQIEQICNGHHHAIDLESYGALSSQHATLIKHMPLTVYMMYSGILDDAQRGKDITLHYATMVKSKEYRIWCITCGANL